MFDIKQFHAEDVEIISEKPCHKGFLSVSSFRLRHPLFAGGVSQEIEREVMLRGKAAGLLPYDPKRQEVVLIEQFRIGAYLCGDTPWLFELVAGIEEPGESLESLVKREALEEAGLQVQGELIKICNYLVSPGGTSEKISLYCGEVDSSSAGGIHGILEEGEDIRVHVVPVEDAFQAVREGQIDNAACIIALQWLEINHRSLYT